MRIGGTTDRHPKLVLPITKSCVRRGQAWIAGNTRDIARLAHPPRRARRIMQCPHNTPHHTQNITITYRRTSRRICKSNQSTVGSAQTASWASPRPSRGPWRLCLVRDRGNACKYRAVHQSEGNKGGGGGRGGRGGRTANRESRRLPPRRVQSTRKPPLGSVWSCGMRRVDYQSINQSSFPVFSHSRDALVAPIGPHMGSATTLKTLFCHGLVGSTMRGTASATAPVTNNPSVEKETISTRVKIVCPSCLDERYPNSAKPL